MNNKEVDQELLNISIELTHINIDDVLPESVDYYLLQSLIRRANDVLFNIQLIHEGLC